MKMNWKKIFWVSFLVLSAFYIYYGIDRARVCTFESWSGRNILTNKCVYFSDRCDVLIIQFLWYRADPACPNSNPYTKSIPESTASSTIFAATLDTSTWVTYHNEKYGFEVKYPADLEIDLQHLGFMSGSNYYGKRDFNLLLLNPTIEPNVSLPTGDQTPTPKYGYGGYNFAIFSGDAALNHIKNQDELRADHLNSLEATSIKINGFVYEIYTVDLNPGFPYTYSFIHFPGNNYQVLVEGNYDKLRLVEILSTFKFLK